MPAVVGIDLAAGRGITEVAVLILEDGSRRPVFDTASHQQVATDTEILAAVSAAHPAVVAIDAPLTLPRAVMSGLADVGAPPAAPADAGDSPYTRAAERDPIWATLGIRPFPVSFLGGLTFRAISLLPRLRATAPSAAVIEVFPGATLRRLGITQPAASGKLAKTAEASRRVVQRGLRQHIEGIALPEDAIYGADLLDALAAALTAVAYLRHGYALIGDSAEGAIVLPA